MKRCVVVIVWFLFIYTIYLVSVSSYRFTTAGCSSTCLLHRYYHSSTNALLFYYSSSTSLDLLCSSIHSSDPMLMCAGGARVPWGSPTPTRRWQHQAHSRTVPRAPLPRDHQQTTRLPPHRPTETAQVNDELINSVSAGTLRQLYGELLRYHEMST